MANIAELAKTLKKVSEGLATFLVEHSHDNHDSSLTASRHNYTDSVTDTDSVSDTVSSHTASATALASDPGHSHALAGTAYTCLPCIAARNLNAMAAGDYTF